MGDMSNIEEYEDHVVVSVNSEIYPLDVVHSAAYALIDDAYLILTGNPEDEILVEIRTRSKKTAKELAMQFNNNLLKFAVYKKQSEKNAAIREAIVKRALLTSELEDIELKSEKTTLLDDEDYGSFEDDSEGIKKEWEDEKKDESDQS